jgi:hypothetical protein
MTHLTEDQIDELLLGDAAADRRAHIRTCGECGARLAAAQEPLASFNAASLAWGERRSATLPLQLQPKPVGLFAGGRLQVAIGVAAVVFACTLARPLLHREAPTESAQQATPPRVPAQPTAVVAQATTPDVDSAQSQTPEDQIARDNQLLQAIDRELASSKTPADLLKMAGQQDATQSSADVTHNE